MESLLVNKKDLLNKINSVLDTLNSIKTDIDFNTSKTIKNQEIWR